MLESCQVSDTLSDVWKKILLDIGVKWSICREIYQHCKENNHTIQIYFLINKFKILMIKRLSDSFSIYIKS